MALNTATLLQIGSYTIPKIKTYKVSYPKLYTDAGRNMAGTLRSTYIGIFPKISAEFSPMTETEFSTLASNVNVGSFSLTYYCLEAKTTQTATFYTNDLEIEVLRKSKGYLAPFSLNFIPFAKR